MKDKRVNIPKEFNRLLHEVDTSKSVSEIFNDFLTLSIYSIAQPFYRSQIIEEKYLNTAKKYSRKQLDYFAAMNAYTLISLDMGMKDFLGEMFNMNSLGEHRKGQFCLGARDKRRYGKDSTSSPSASARLRFTPYHVSKLMGRLHCINLKVDIENKDFITMCEPCCGSGGMVIAFADCMKEEGINFQQKLYVEAMDIDEICFKMAYLQLSLLGIAAKVQLGDSLTLKVKETLYTPMFFINGFYRRLKEFKEIEEVHMNIPVQLRLIDEEIRI